MWIVQFLNKEYERNGRSTDVIIAGRVFLNFPDVKDIIRMIVDHNECMTSHFSHCNMLKGRDYGDLNPMPAEYDDEWELKGDRKFNDGMYDKIQAVFDKAFELLEINTEEDFLILPEFKHKVRRTISWK